MKVQPLRRRSFLSLSAGVLAANVLGNRTSSAAEPELIRFGLTPVLLTSDLDLLELLRSYLAKAADRPVQLVTRRTYQEITALLVSGQLLGAWICSLPFCAHSSQLQLLAVPVWKGKPLYQSYLIADAGRPITSIKDLSGDVHAFSDPDSNSGYLATAAELAGNGIKAERFFRQIFFTYGHRNVVRAVASGLAQSGSVDGYVYDVLQEVEPSLTKSTRVVRASPWFGFPPIAGPVSMANTDNWKRLRQALLTMHRDAKGREVLHELRLDSFSDEPASLFDPVAANIALVRGLA